MLNSEFLSSISDKCGLSLPVCVLCHRALNSEQVCVFCGIGFEVVVVSGSVWVLPVSGEVSLERWVDLVAGLEAHRIDLFCPKCEDRLNRTTEDVLGSSCLFCCGVLWLPHFTAVGDFALDVKSTAASHGFSDKVSLLSPGVYWRKVAAFAAVCVLPPAAVASVAAVGSSHASSSVQRVGTASDIIAFLTDHICESRTGFVSRKALYDRYRGQTETPVSERMLYSLLRQHFVKIREGRKSILGVQERVFFGISFIQGSKIGS